METAETGGGRLGPAIRRHTQAFRYTAHNWARQFRQEGRVWFGSLGCLALIFLVVRVIPLAIWLAGALVLLAGWLVTMLLDVLFIAPQDVVRAVRR